MSRVFTPVTLAQRWECRPNRILKLIRQGELEGFQVGTLWRVREEAVLAYEDSQQGQSSDMPADVYIIRGGGFIKIGKAANVSRRLASMRTSQPFEVEVVKTFEDCDGHTLERDLHQRFADSRHRGEWFREEGDLATWLKEGCPL